MEFEDALGRKDNHDEKLQGTNDDAAISKLSAVNFGYYDDPFLKFFVGKTTKRSPLIHRGYYARVNALTTVIDEFLSVGHDGKQQQPHQQPVRRQIISLGAGFDTRYFRLKAEHKQCAKFIEVDFESVARRKMALLARHRELRNLLPQPVEPTMERVPQVANPTATAIGTEPSPSKPHSSTAASAAAAVPDGATIWNFGDYAFIGTDLRNTSMLEDAFRVAGADLCLPTLVLCECVLVYLQPNESMAVLSWLSKNLFGGALLVNYEQILPGDAFGRQMVSNFKDRGAPLLGIDKCPTLKSQEERYLEAGWHTAVAWNLNDVYNCYLPRADLRRIEPIELFDELEEWHLIQSHYCISMAFLRPGTKSGYSPLATLGILNLDREALNRQRLQESAQVDESVARKLKVVEEYRRRHDAAAAARQPQQTAASMQLQASLASPAPMPVVSMLQAAAPSPAPQGAFAAAPGAKRLHPSGSQAQKER